MDRILILQSYSRCFSLALDYFRKQYPESEITVVSSRDSSIEPDVHKEVDNVIEVEGFHPGDQELLATINENDYEAVVVLSRDIYSNDYRNVEKLAQNVRASTRYLFDQSERCKKINSFLLFNLWRIVRKAGIYTYQFAVFSLLCLILIPIYLIQNLNNSSRR